MQVGRGLRAPALEQADGANGTLLEEAKRKRKPFSMNTLRVASSSSQ